MYKFLLPIHICNQRHIFETPLDVLLFIIVTGLMIVGMLSLYDERWEMFNWIWSMLKRLLYLLYKFIELWK